MRLGFRWYGAIADRRVEFEIEVLMVVLFNDMRSY